MQSSPLFIGDATAITDLGMLCIFARKLADTLHGGLVLSKPFDLTLETADTRCKAGIERAISNRRGHSSLIEVRHHVCIMGH